jgi:hypothetical protein
VADVFVSYSRDDAGFVRRLVDARQARDKDVWVDVEGIRDAEVFPAALRSAIEGSDGFAFVISPGSVASHCVWDACAACGDAKALPALARSQVTRQLTAKERRTFLGS